MVTLPEAIAAMGGSDVELANGTVILVNANLLTVLVRGVTIQAAFVGDTPPPEGSLVALIRDRWTWLCLGRLGGVGVNQVENFSFEDDGLILTTPSKWFLYQISGSGSASAAATGVAPAGTYELSVTAGGAAQDTYVYSSPISVVPGQQWSVSAFATAAYPSGAPITADAALYGLWFASSGSLYPATSAADTLISQTNDIGPFPTHVPVSGTVTVPAATTYMRIATRSLSAAGVTMYWDAVIARLIG
jgi:hypothetical protein